ncbi:MAG: DEAD/DEAH box helicase family protein, partial [Leptolyngbya sp.]|nr:DEAD/DEAH box helicase family protein [Candidatus Melainabacteria bacterium]
MANKSSQNQSPSATPAPDPSVGTGAAALGAPLAPPIEIDYSEPSSTLQHLHFRYPLRRYQEEILGMVNSKLARGERQIHIVAPPGAGKTIIGLQLISTLKCNALILAPNTTIQSQWGQKLDSFIPPELEGMISLADILGTHEDKPLKPITVLTYQVLST